MSTEKIALFGGTFDPIHLGHTKVALEAADRIGADVVFFIPARHSALKSSAPQAPEKDRLKMIELAISEIDIFRISDCELKKPAPSFTMDTVRYFKSLYPKQTEFFWLLGADAVRELPRWHKIKELIDECNVSTMYRGGFEKPDFTPYQNEWGGRRVKKMQENIIRTSLIDIDSTEIRNKATEGLDISGMVHPDVAEYIDKHNLYKPG